MSRVNTPGVLGYAASILAAFTANALFLSVLYLPEQPRYWTLAFVIVFVYECIVGLVVAVPGVLAVHSSCRSHEEQWVHVLAAVAAGLVGGLVLLLFTGGGVGLAVSVSVTVSAGLGRLAVIPSVRRRRRRLAPSAPVRVP